MKLRIVALGLVLLLIGLGLGVFVGEYSSSPSSVHLTGYVQAFYYNTTGGPSHTFTPSFVEFFYYHCSYSATATCESQYNATITDASYSVTVPNGHLYYINLGNSNVFGGCLFGGMPIPIYSYASSMNYNISSICYSTPA